MMKRCSASRFKASIVFLETLSLGERKTIIGQQTYCVLQVRTYLAKLPGNESLIQELSGGMFWCVTWAASRWMSVLYKLYV